MNGLGYTVAVGGATSGSDLVLNVKDHGATGDGTTDDTTAIQAAIDAAPADGGCVFLPAGTYRITNVLTVRSGITLAGAGQYATVIEQTNATKQAIYGVDVTAGLTIRDLRLSGPSDGITPGTIDAVLLERTGGLATQNVAFENLYIDHWSRHGLSIDDPITSTFSNVRVQTVAGDGFHVTTGTSLTFQSCYANGCAGGGYRLTSTAYSILTGCAADSCPTGYTLSGCSNVVLAGCGAEATAGDSYTVTGGTGVSLLSCYSSGNTAVAFLITANAVRTVLTNVWERNPSGAPTASIKVDAGSTATVISPTVVTAPVYATGTTNVLGTGVLDITSGGTSINGVNRAATTNFAAYVLRTAGVDRWAMQMLNSGNNDLVLSDSGNGSTAMLVEARATAPNLSLLTATKSYGGGVGVVFVPNASTVPTSNPAGGGVLYVEGGALKYRGSGGTVTTIGPA